MSEPRPSSSPTSSSEPVSSSDAGGRRGELVKKKRKRRTKQGDRSTPVPSVLANPWLRWGGLGALLAVAAALTLLLVVYPSRVRSGEGRVVDLVIPGDESAGALAARLHAAGVIDSEALFALYVRMTGGAGKVAAGAHLLTDDLSPEEVLRRIERKGGAARAKVVIPEGWNRFDIARRLAKEHVCSQKAFEAASADRALLAELALEEDSFEGYLFPATYELAKDSDPKDVVRRLKAEFDRRWGALERDHVLGLAELDRSLGWKRHEIVVLASIIEKEAAVDDERPVIASVFLNRMRDPSFKRKVLQSDPTAGYGCVAMRERIPSCAGYTGKITHDINMDPQNPYGTYVRERLPPGPIANPGTKSLAAVLAPATTRYLYFVARGEGRHAFSETYEGHTTVIKNQKSPPAGP